MKKSNSLAWFITLFLSFNPFSQGKTRKRKLPGTLSSLIRCLTSTFAHARKAAILWQGVFDISKMVFCHLRGNYGENVTNIQISSNLLYCHCYWYYYFCNYNCCSSAAAPACATNTAFTTAAATTATPTASISATNTATVTATAAAAVTFNNYSTSARWK